MRMVQLSAYESALYNAFQRSYQQKSCLQTMGLGSTSRDTHPSVLDVGPDDEAEQNSAVNCKALRQSETYTSVEFTGTQSKSSSESLQGWIE